MSPLEKLCFDLIVKEFERFAYAFTTTKDKNLQQDLEFLQRRFSSKLAMELSNHTDIKLKEEYLGFLFNQYLEYFNVLWLKNSTYLNAVEDFFFKFPNLTRIDFINEELNADVLLKNVAKFCHEIVDINLIYSSATDNGVKYLCEIKNGMPVCPKLKNLFIRGSLVTNKGAEYLIRNLPTLEKFDYPDLPLVLYSMHEQNLSESNGPLLLYSMHQKNSAQSEKVLSCNLIELKLSQFRELPYYTDILKTCLTMCPKLKQLDCFIPNKEQLDLFTNCHLEKLMLLFHIENGRINIDNFLRINGCNLSYLSICGCTLSVAALKEYCPELKEFNADDIYFTDANDPHINFLPLTKLHISDIDPSMNKAMSRIISPNLETLFMESCILSPEMKTQILLWCENSSARAIGFTSVSLDIEFLKNVLLRCPFLKEMHLFQIYGATYNHKKELRNLAESLPNKPHIFFSGV